MIVTERCWSCKYFSGDKDKYPCCDYIGHTGHSRGCPAGDDCDKYKERGSLNADKQQAKGSKV